jgi:membrane protease YdiL (CAAX protease family)
VTALGRDGLARLAPHDNASAARRTSLTRSLLWIEVVLVMSVSLGRSGVYALVNLIATWTAPGGLSEQHAVLNGSRAPGREWLDLSLQLLAILFSLVPAFLAGYLLVRDGADLRLLWFDRRRLGPDTIRGLVLAAVVGGTGLMFYLVTYASGVDLTVVAEDLPHVWWRFPVLVLAAAQNALLEEIVVLGYLLTRFDDLGLPRSLGVPIAAVLRGSYHLYQGLGGFAGNLVMGLLFGWLYTRWGRITPMVVAHTVLDIVAFVGFALLAGHVSWLPT